MIIAGGVLAGFSFIASVMGFDLVYLQICTFYFAPGLLLVLAMVVWPKAPVSGRLRAWGVIFFALFLSVVWTRWPFCASFALHKPCLEKIANQVQASGTVNTPSRIGVFRFRQMRVIHNGNVGLQLTGGSGGGTYLVRRAGEAGWLPLGPQRVWYNTNWEISLGDEWYLVYQD